MAITTLHPDPLSGFHDIKPSLNLSDRCTFSVTPNYIFLNKKCFDHFKGSRDLKIECNTNLDAFAVVNTYHDDPDVLGFALNKGNRSYNNLMNRGVLHKLDKALPQLGIQLGQHSHIYADRKDIGKNYIIFRADKKHLRH